MRRQMPTRSPYSRSVTAAMFLPKTAFAGGARWLERWWDSRVAKFSGHTSHGTMKVTAIFALSGHSIGFGHGKASPRRRFPGDVHSRRHASWQIRARPQLARPG